MCDSSQFQRIGKHWWFKFSINPFHVTDLFWYPLKTSENLWFCDVFRGYQKWSVAWNGFTLLHKNICIFFNNSRGNTTILRDLFAARLTLSVKFCRLKVTKFLETFVTFNRQNFLNDKIDKRRIFFTVEISHQILIFYSKCLFLFFTSLEHLELYLQSKKGTMGGIFCKKVRNSIDSNLFSWKKKFSS